MIVKVLQNKKGEYLKDFCLETIDDLFYPVTGLNVLFGLQIILNEAMHFYSSISAIVAKKLGRAWI